MKAKPLPVLLPRIKRGNIKFKKILKSNNDNVWARFFLATSVSLLLFLWLFIWY